MYLIPFSKHGPSHASLPDPKRFYHPTIHGMAIDIPQSSLAKLTSDFFFFDEKTLSANDSDVCRVSGDMKNRELHKLEDM